MLELKLENATFIKNPDGTYTVYQLIQNGYMKFPRVSIDIKAEAMVDPETEAVWEWIDGADWHDETDTYKPTVWSKIKHKIRSVFGSWR